MVWTEAMAEYHRQRHEDAERAAEEKREAKKMREALEKNNPELKKERLAREAEEKRETRKSLMRFLRRCAKNLAFILAGFLLCAAMQ